jgi:hypothetical protein
MERNYFPEGPVDACAVSQKSGEWFFQLAE